VKAVRHMAALVHLLYIHSCSDVKMSQLWSDIERRPEYLSFFKHFWQTVEAEAFDGPPIVDPLLTPW
jgi:hypothetical protein